MSDVAIKVENLSKRYRIGVKEEIHDTFVRAITSAVKNPMRNLRQLRRLSEFEKDGQEAEDILWALKDVSFEVKQGEVLGVIGRNGAGKSTLLKILSKITYPTSGRIEMNGRISSLLEVGTGFHPELTGRDNIYLNGTILGMRKKEIDQKLDEIIDFSGVEKFIDTPVKRYSSGMRVRLAFSVAAHLEPEILLIDEVLAVGDIEFQKKCLGKMDEVAKGGRTVIFVSHNMASVRKLCQRGILLSGGKNIYEGEINHVVDNYIFEDKKKQVSEILLPEKGKNSFSKELGRGVKLSLVSKDGYETTNFKIFESWKIILEFFINQPLKHVIAGVGLVRLDGMSIITFWSEPKQLDPGYYKVEFDCNLPLQAGNLSLTVGLSENERSFYYVENQGIVKILDVAVGAQPIRVSGTGLLLSTNFSKIEDC